jgi:hypothetical protein
MRRMSQSAVEAFSAVSTWVNPKCVNRTNQTAIDTISGVNAMELSLRDLSQNDGNRDVTFWQSVARLKNSFKPGSRRVREN